MKKAVAATEYNSLVVLRCSSLSILVVDNDSATMGVMIDL